MRGEVIRTIDIIVSLFYIQKDYDIVCTLLLKLA